MQRGLTTQERSIFQKPQQPLSTHLPATSSPERPKPTVGLPSGTPQQQTAYPQTLQNRKVESGEVA